MEQRTTVTEYLSTGLAARDGVLYFADRQSPSTVLGWLTSTGVDTGSVLLDGQLRVVTAEDSYLAPGRFDPEAMIAALCQEADDSLASGFRGLRVCGEMSRALRGVAGSERLEDYERRVDEVFTGRPVSTICQYDARLFPTDRLETFDHCHRARWRPHRCTATACCG